MSTRKEQQWFQKEGRASHIRFGESKANTWTTTNRADYPVIHTHNKVYGPPEALRGKRQGISFGHDKVSYKTASHVVRNPWDKLPWKEPQQVRVRRLKLQPEHVKTREELTRTNFSLGDCDSSERFATTSISSRYFADIASKRKFDYLRRPGPRQSEAGEQDKHVAEQVKRRIKETSIYFPSTDRDFSTTTREAASSPWRMGPKAVRNARGNRQGTRAQLVKTSWVTGDARTDWGTSHKANYREMHSGYGRGAAGSKQALLTTSLYFGPNKKHDYRTSSLANKHSPTMTHSRSSVCL